jgi:RNA polymerase sigma-70 factor (sigma-E family)
MRLTGAGTPRLPSRSQPPATDEAALAVEELYREHALELIRLGYVILGDRAAAEDVAQEAFCGLYRRWDRLSKKDSAPAYLRSSVLNGCRSALRRRRPDPVAVPCQLLAASAEAAVLTREQRDEVIRAIIRLPDRQREALVLRFYLDLPDQEIARVMGTGTGAVRSSVHRALAALAQMLKGE